ncbi:hypothetical protein GCM10009801_43840 [Streptomyces albiaxialis]|uniref:Uncharacterized protein n=1 Tax=Streptomyces albiaxialis TaxID=329523 RepID=A0ABP5HRT5_9ACTN
MSQEAAPGPGAPEGPGAPKGLLEQMEEMMAALTADLSQLDADLQSADLSSADLPVSGERRPAAEEPGPQH